jgi:hypothetical protein
LKAGRQNLNMLATALLLREFAHSDLSVQSNQS